MYPSMLRESQRARPAAGLPAGTRSSSWSKADQTEGFLYNGRVAACMLTSLLCVLSVDSMAIASGTLVAGSMIAYVLDALRHREGSFLTVWASLVLTNVALAYSVVFEDGLLHHHRHMLSATVSVSCRLLLNSLLLFLVGTWATLQYRWVQRQYPAVVMAFEKMLVTGCVPVGGSLLSWGLITNNGIASAPFLSSAVLCVMYASFCRPLPSSFGRAYSSTSSATIQGRFDAALAFMFVLVTPTLTYVAAHNETIFSWVHAWSLVLLFSMPLLCMSALPRGLWWLGASGAASACKRVLVLVGLAGVLAGFEGRIVFHSFGQYIKIAPPFSYIAITLALYGMASIALLHVSGMMGDQVRRLYRQRCRRCCTMVACQGSFRPSIWSLLRS